jgi:hypothetical protein
LGCRIDESCGSDEKNASGPDEAPEKPIGVSGVSFSDVIVTGRQKVEVSEVKRLKASCSSEETGYGVSAGRSIGRPMRGLRNVDCWSLLDVPEIPDCMMPMPCWDPGLIKWLFTERGEAVRGARGDLLATFGGVHLSKLAKTDIWASHRLFFFFWTINLEKPMA